jgi:signal transduction histidine kinase
MAGRLSDCGGPLGKEAVKLREMLSQAALEVERISRNLRSDVLEHLGLGVVLRDASSDFSHRTGVSIKLACVQLVARLPAETELALYRILQEALKNVETHACARSVTVRLRRQGAFVELAINDDGIGFDPDHLPAGRKGSRGLGLIGMRERASHVGGALTIKSVRRTGTKIEARVPLA